MRLRDLLPRWKHIEDIDRPGDIYLSRLMLVRTPLFGVYLHIIRRPDWAQCEHDHPWPFVTMILAGGYEEIVDGVRHIRGPGYVGYRPRDFEHRIVRLPSGRAISLVLRGANHEEWGFRTTAGKIGWREYMRWPAAVRVAWCDDSREEEARR